MPAVLVVTGLIALGIGAWRSYAAARLALAPIVHSGEPTLTAVDAGRPVLARVRVRRTARHVALSIAWLLVAGYGLFLASTGLVAR